MTTNIREVRRGPEDAACDMISGPGFILPRADAERLGLVMRPVTISGETRAQLEDLLTRIANGVMPTDIAGYWRQQEAAAEILRHVRAATR